MALYPDLSDDSNFSDDDDYYNFKERTIQGHYQTRELNEAEQKDQQKKLLYSALCSGNKQAVVQHLEDVNVNVQDEWTPLLLSASFGNAELTEELIIRGADVKAVRGGCTALMLACNCPTQTSPFKETLKVIKYLVENGANVKTINRKRMTALMFAANNGNLQAVKYLLPLSNKNAEDNQRWTALFWAVNGNAVETVKYLLEEGLQYTTSDIRNNTPIDIAKNSDYAEILELFPKEEDDLISDIMDRFPSPFEEISALQPGERPKFFLDVYNICCGVKSEHVIKVLANKDVSLSKLLSISNDELKQLGVKLPYQRERILGGVYRFHKYPFHSSYSIYAVPLDQIYSNVDVAIQLLSTIKQAIAMESSLTYLMKNYSNEDILEDERLSLSKTVENIRNKIRLCRIMTKRIMKKTKRWDDYVKPADLITPHSRRYKIHWRKIIFSLSAVSLVLVFNFYN